MFRIVSECRGEVVVGFRVQQMGWVKNHDSGLMSEVWRNRGKRVFTIDDAEHIRGFLIQQHQAATQPMEYKVVSEPTPGAWSAMERRIR